jgi:hypothetical protein
MYRSATARISPAHIYLGAAWSSNGECEGARTIPRATTGIAGAREGRGRVVRWRTLYQFSRCGFCFRQPASEGNTVVMGIACGAPPNHGCTVSRHFK